LYDGNSNRIRKQQNGSDELYVLGAGGETEAVFNAGGTAKFFNIIAGKEVIGRYEPEIDSLKLSNLSLNRTYSARHIVTGTQVVVPTEAELKAGTDIRLKPGFTTLDGSNFNALIDNSILTPQRYYYVKDHLGSIRVTVDQAGEIISYDDYDPWGMQLEGRSDNLADGNDKFKFTGKERDTETNYDYFGARYYDSRIGRWLQADPLSEKYPACSGYIYILNDPISSIDPDGKYRVDLIDGRVMASRVSPNEAKWYLRAEAVPGYFGLACSGMRYLKNDPSLGKPSLTEMAISFLGGKLI
jgi:RHS repeat-associated protein